jgi:SAM-dependent methyltransferase
MNGILKKCRICGNEDLKEVLNLGHQPLADAFLTEEQLMEPETYYPLNLLHCEKCGLAQLGYVVNRETLYQNAYPYTTGSNKEGIKHFNEFAQDVIERYSLTSNDLVVDIGSNDGTFLKNFQDHGCKVLGVDPSHVKSCVETHREFFDISVATYITEFKYKQKAKVITAANVFAHVDDLHGFMKGIDYLLADDGVFIIEAPHLGSMLKNNAWDQVYHEHLSYLWEKPIEELIVKYGFTIDFTEKYPIHCGSLRYFIKKSDIQKNWLDPWDFRIFKKDEPGCFIEKESVYPGISAPAKGNVFLNHYKFKLPYIAEINPLKIGKYTPGTHIPIVHEDRLIEDQPECAMILAWNWKDQIIKNLRAKGYKGKFIVPLPEVEVIE